MKNKNKIIGILFILIFSFGVLFANNVEQKEDFEKILIEKDNKIKEKEEEFKKEKEKIINEKKEIINTYVEIELEKIKEQNEKSYILQKKYIKKKKEIAEIRANTCGLLSQIGGNKFIREKKCEDRIFEDRKEENNFLLLKEDEKEIKKIKEIKPGYTEDGKKIKWMLTRYFTPEYNQDYFKNTWKNGRVTYGGKLYPKTDGKRWTYFMADGVMQCGTRWVPYTNNKKKKAEIINGIEQACLSPGITPFKNIEGKEKDLLSKEDANKIIACDYKYLADIADMDCNPVIYNSTPRNEWQKHLDCRKRINNELDIVIKGLGKVKCADSGGNIKLAHFDIWTGIGNQALRHLEKDSIGNIKKSSYRYDIDGKLLPNGKTREAIYAEVDIYKNGKKVY